MANIEFVSSLHEKQRLGSDSSIVTKMLDPDRILSEAEIEQLQQIASMPDESIRTDLIPEASPEAWKTAKQNPWARRLAEGSLRKAS